MMKFYTKHQRVQHNLNYQNSLIGDKSGLVTIETQLYYNNEGK